MARPDVSSYATYDDIARRLDEIVSAVRDKDTSLERSLDLFDEAIELGSKAVDMVDDVRFTEEEATRLEEGAEQATGDEEGAAAPAQQ